MKNAITDCMSNDLTIMQSTAMINFNRRKYWGNALLSELFYFEYLTIMEKEDENLVKFKIPNKAIKNLYEKYLSNEVKE